MRRLLALVPLLLLVSVATGCAGADAQRAQELLARSDAALEDVRSYSFSARVWTSGAPQDVSFLMRGGAYQRGRRAGDFFVEGSVESAPGLGDFGLAGRKGRLWARFGASWTRLPDPPTPPAGADPLAGLDPTRFVTDVDVEEGELLDGEPAVKITGLIDTSGLLAGTFGQLGQVTQGGLDLPGSLGDTRIVMWLSEASLLPLRALVDLSMDVAGERVDMHMDFSFGGFGEPVALPPVG